MSYSCCWIFSEFFQLFKVLPVLKTQWQYVFSLFADIPGLQTAFRHHDVSHLKPALHPSTWGFKKTRIFPRSNNWNWILTSQRLVFQPLVPHCKCRSIHLPKLLSPDEATNVTIAGTRSLKDFELWHVCWQAMNVHDKNPTLLPSLTAPLGQVNLAGPVCSPPLYKLTWFQQLYILFPTCNQTLNHKKVIGSNLQSKSKTQPLQTSTDPSANL